MGSSKPRIGERRPRGTRPSRVARLLESRAGPALIGHDHVSYPGEPVSLLAQAEGMSVPHPPIVVRMPCRAGGVAHVRVKVRSSDRSPGLNLLHRPWELAAVVRVRASVVEVRTPVVNQLQSIFAGTPAQALCRSGGS